MEFDLPESFTAVPMRVLDLKPLRRVEEQPLEIRIIVIFFRCGLMH